MKLVNIGFGSLVAVSRIITLIAPDSAPVKRMIVDARSRGILVDATFGRRTRAVIVMDSGHIILSAIQPETVASRISGKSEKEFIEDKGGDDDGDEE